MGIRMKQELVTPHKAERWLKLNKENRNIRSGCVWLLAREMKEGEWKENGETIKFDVEGNLIDGQHRLSAIIKSGCSQKIFIARGVERVAFPTIDQGTSRSLSDNFNSAGELLYSELSTAVRTVYELTGGFSDARTRRLTPQYGFRTLEEHPGIRASVRYVMNGETCDIKRMRIVGVGVAAGMHYLMAQKDKEAADRFWFQVGTGEKLDRGSVPWKLRDVLIKNKMAVEKTSGETTKMLIIKAWNAYRNGKSTFARKLTEDDRSAEIK